MTHAIMKENGLLIKSKTRSRYSREHTGRVMVDTPNTRWASDITSIKFWDGTKARLSYIIDCCDRSIISWKFSRHMQASDIELLLQDALLKRFGGEIPNGNDLEFLHDNGPEYIEGHFKDQMKEWDVINCNTPTYSPQSNGISEAFNGTFKRDYVYQSCLDDFETVEKQIGEWFHLYNTFAPHSALGMKTPYEFLESLEEAA
jgi:putative transposase